MVRTNKYVLMQLAVAVVAHVVNVREGRLLLALVRLANVVRRPFRTRVGITVMTLAEQRRERLWEAASLLRELRVWEEANEVFGPAGVEEQSVPAGWGLVETVAADDEPIGDAMPVPLPPWEREVAVPMPAACQTTERPSRAMKPEKPKRERRPRTADAEREAKLTEAAGLVREQGMSVKEAARRTQVPESTLRRRLKAK